MKTRINPRITLMVAALSACAFVSSALAASVWTNPITGTNPGASNPYTNGDVADVHLSVSGIGHGTGVSNTSANDRYNMRGWDTVNLDPTAYFTWTLTPGGGYTLNLDSFVYTGQVSATNPVTNFAFRSSLDNFASDIGSPTATGTTINLSGATYQGLTSPVEFRLYGWGTSASTSTFSVNDFTFNGTVVPEPTTVLGGVLALAGLLYHQRRRVSGLLRARAA